MVVELTRLGGGPKIGSLPYYTPHGWDYPTGDPGTNYVPLWSASGTIIWTSPAGVAALIDHNLLTDLTGHDDHTQYLYLAGRAAAQQDITKGLTVSTYARLGSATAPTNTTAGDLSVGRIFVPDQATGLFGLINVYDNGANVPLITRQDSSASVPAIRVWKAGSNIIPAIQLLASRGTVASPTAVQLNDTIGQLQASGFVDANTISASTPRIKWFATENWSAGNEGSECRIAVTPKTTNIAQERLKVADPAIEYTSYSVRATNSSGTQSIAPATLTVITFNAEDYDTGAMHNTSSTTSRLTAPVTGRYAVSGGVLWAAEALSTTTYLVLRINKNGTTIEGSRVFVGASAIIATVGEAMNVSCDVALAANDYVELEVFFDAGIANRTIQSTNCAFSMRYIGGF